MKNWDYSSHGFYFVTICALSRVEYFGEVRDGMMCLGRLGELAQSYWQKISSQFSMVNLDDFIVMPNHIHGIVQFSERSANGCRGAINRAPTTIDVADPAKMGGVTGENNPMGKGVLGEVMRWFKGRCTFEIGKQAKEEFRWQRGFYDEVVQENARLDEIRKYIKSNPENWEMEKAGDYGLYY